MQPEATSDNGNDAKHTTTVTIESLAPFASIPPTQIGSSTETSISFLVLGGNDEAAIEEAHTKTIARTMNAKHD